MLCSHPADFTPVCTTELGSLAKILPELTKRNVKVACRPRTSWQVLGLSCNDVESHLGWIKDIQVRPLAHRPLTARLPTN